MMNPKKIKFPIIMIGVTDDPKSGGDLFNYRIYSYFQDMGIRVVSLPIPKDISWIPLFLRLIISNFLILKNFKHLGVTNGFIYQDCYSHPRLLLTNWWASKRNFNISMLMQMSIDDQHKLHKYRFFRKVDRFLLQYSLRFGNLYFANSQDSKEVLLSLGCTEEKIKIVGCGFDFRFENNMTSYSRRNKTKGINILSVGNIQHRKGTHVLIDAIALLKDLDIKVNIVGGYSADHNYFKRLRTSVIKNHLEDIVVFHGRVSEDDLNSFYLNSDIFILPSLHETFGIVLLEAMSFGLPIIATSVGAISELVINGVNGILVLPNDPNSLAKSIQNLVNSPKLLEKYGKNGYHFISENKNNYSWETVGNRIADAFLTL